VSAVGGIYVRSTALQELRPLSATSPSGPVCSTPGASVSAPSIATESVRVVTNDKDAPCRSLSRPHHQFAYSMISDTPRDASYITSLQCFGQAAPYTTTDALWRDVLLCGAYSVEPTCSTPTLVSLFTFPAMHSFATARDFTQLLVRQAQDLARFDGDLAALSGEFARLSLFFLLLLTPASFLGQAADRDSKVGTQRSTRTSSLPWEASLC
jgi:hypothetical protein